MHAKFTITYLQNYRIFHHCKIIPYSIEVSAAQGLVNAQACKLVHGGQLPHTNHPEIVSST
jgi:hypothetical protein